jgi:hypothetical protein
MLLTLSQANNGKMHNAISAFLTSPVHHTGLLLVHPEVRRLEDAANELVSAYGWPRLSVGRELSAVLLSDPSMRRSHTARRWMETRLGQMAPGSVLCTEIDLLFEPSLDLDPLMLLRHVSRITRWVVTWPGSYLDDVLAYAVPEHSHYRTWRRPGVAITCL